MTLTRHGHHIKGTTIDNEDPKRVMGRCGGPGNCIPCTEDELDAFQLDKNRSR